MAVIETNGDGYTLFNGVKLPSLPEYDEEKYPYMIITKINGYYYAYVVTVPYIFDGNFINFEPHTRNLYRKQDGAEKWDTLKTDAEIKTANSIPATQVPIWSNYDIINTTDNSVYLTASEPIALDGMNVIEWDGNTEGLESIDTNAYFVSYNDNVDTNKDVVCKTSASDVVITTMMERDGYWTLNRRVNFTPVPVGGYPAGIEFYNFYDYHTSLFAYYPIKSSGNEKTNIYFNDKTYSINTSSLISYSDVLKSHLSTTMSGTGATITLGGTTYNVDSAKLSAATNDFVTHLGTIAGSGYKVVVGGVEYGIDSNKMAGAVAEIEAVLGGLHINDGDSGDVGGDGDEVIAAGLYQTGSNYTVLLKDWDTLLAEGVIHVDNGVVTTNMDLEAYYNSSSDALDGDLILPSDGSVTTLGEGAFEGCLKLTGIIIPDSVVAINDYAFFEINLETVVIGDCVEYIGHSSFYQCPNLKSVTIGNGVEFMGNCVFWGCSALENVTFNGTLDQWDVVCKNNDWAVGISATYVQCSDGIGTFYM